MKWGTQENYKVRFDMWGECVISSVLSCSKNLKQRTSVTAYISALFGKQRKYSLKAWEWAYPKEACGSILALLFICPTPPPHLTPTPLSLSYVNWVSQEGCFSWGSHSGSWTFLCSIFVCFFLSLFFSHHYFGLLFPILTTWHFLLKRWEAQFLEVGVSRSLWLLPAVSCYSKASESLYWCPSKGEWYFPWLDVVLCILFEWTLYVVAYWPGQRQNGLDNWWYDNIWYDIIYHIIYDNHI